MSRKKTISTAGADKGIYHRPQFTICPHCEHETDRATHNDPWWKTAHTLVLQPANYKSGCIAIISECPSCFESSWVHQRMTGFDWGYEWPEKWKAAVKKEEDRVKLEAVRAWPRGLCWQCKHLTSATVEYHAWRHCVVGSGEPKTECKQFDPV